MHDCCQGLCCILTNLEERTLLDLLPGRQQERVTRRLMSMANRHQVEIVSMDMWKPYRRAFQTVLPQARIVVDKFHVVRMANEALEKIRKGLRKELKPNLRIPANVTGHSGDRDRFAHGHHAGVSFVL